MILETAHRVIDVNILIKSRVGGSTSANHPFDLAVVHWIGGTQSTADLGWAAMMLPERRVRNHARSTGMANHDVACAFILKGHGSSVPLSWDGGPGLVYCRSTSLRTWGDTALVAISELV